MRGPEFRALRLRYRWSVRGAARTLGVTPSTIQRWEQGATIPSEIADRLRVWLTADEVLEQYAW